MNKTTLSELSTKQILVWQNTFKPTYNIITILGLIMWYFITETLLLLSTLFLMERGVDNFLVVMDTALSLNKLIYPVLFGLLILSIFERVYLYIKEKKWLKEISEEWD